jgi:cell division protein FtsL
VSVPASRLPSTSSAPPSPRREASSERVRVAPPARTTAARLTPSTPPQRRARRGSHAAFWLFSGVLVAGLVMGVVALNALVVNTTYRLQSLETHHRAVSDEGADLRIEAARLSSPSRISEWATGVGMVLPATDEVVPLRVPGTAIEREPDDGGSR